MGNSGKEEQKEQKLYNVPIIFCSGVGGFEEQLPASSDKQMHSQTNLMPQLTALCLNPRNTPMRDPSQSTAGSPQLDKMKWGLEKTPSSCRT